MAPDAAWTFLPDLLEEHLEEIQFLWPIRERGIRSPRMTLRGLQNFEDRLDAHAEGILVAGEDAYPLIDPLLEADDNDATFTATFVLLRIATEIALSRIRDALASARGKRLTGMGRALQLGRSDGLLESLGAVFGGDDEARSATAAEALSYHVRWKGSHDRLLQHLTHEDPAVKKAGWRVIGNLGIVAEPKLYAAAMRDEELAVRDAALTAAAWTGVQGTIGIVRSAAASPSKDNFAAHRLLAALGEPADLPAIRQLVTTSSLGPERFALATSFGHPSLAPLLLDAISSENKREAIAAGEAFARLTGANLGPGEPVTLPPEDGHEPDEFEKEFLDEDVLPDPAKARAHWDRVGPSLAGFTRIAHGRDISSTIPADAFSWMDMQTRYEWWMRARFRGTWSGSPMQLEVFPQR
jgi:uncharacterized protein (TIGR02270 family)